MKTMLVIDANNLAWKSFYAIKDLQQDDLSVGVLYGFLRDVLLLRERLMADTIVFCFDYGMPIRKQIYPQYKAGRGSNTKRLFGEKEYERIKSEANRQIDLLRVDILKRMAFKNVFWQEGYEADDLIAYVVKNADKDTKKIIVSNDKDMYQLLGKNTVIFNHSSKQFYDEQLFMDEWGIHPVNWADAKAFAGEKGTSRDNIEGIDGVGEKTAIKWMKGELQEKSKSYAKINEDRGKTYDRNILLTRLPYPGAQTPKIIPGDAMPDNWNAVVESMQMDTLVEATMKKRRTPKQVLQEDHGGEVYEDSTGEW